jgi:hypothetical protein
MIEEQTGEGKEPQEEDQEQAAVEVQLAIPALKAPPRAGEGF